MAAQSQAEILPVETNIVSSSSEDDTAGAGMRSFAIPRNPSKYKAKFASDEKAVYTEIPYKSALVNVTITACQQEPSGRWVYQLEDEEGEAIKETGQDEPAWIGEGKLSKLRKPKKP